MCLALRCSAAYGLNCTGHAPLYVARRMSETQSTPWAQSRSTSFRPLGGDVRQRPKVTPAPKYSMGRINRMAQTSPSLSTIDPAHTCSFSLFYARPLGLSVEADDQSGRTVLLPGPGVDHGHVGQLLSFLRSAAWAFGRSGQSGRPNCLAAWPRSRSWPWPSLFVRSAAWARGSVRRHRRRSTAEAGIRARPLGLEERLVAHGARRQFLSSYARPLGLETL